MSNERKLSARADKQRMGRRAPMKADYRVIRNNSRELGDYAEAYNSKNNKRSRTQRVLRWFQRQFCCTSRQIPNELKQNTVRQPLISMSRNPATTLPHIDTSNKPNDQLTNDSVLFCLESSIRNNPNAELDSLVLLRQTTNDRTRTSRSTSIGVNRSTEALVNSTIKERVSISTVYPDSKTEADRRSQTHLPKIHGVESSITNSERFLRSPRKALPGRATSESLPTKSNFGILDAKKFQSIQISAFFPEYSKKPTSTARSFEVNSKILEQTNVPQIHASQSNELTPRLTTSNNEPPQRSPEVLTQFIPGRCGLKNLGNTCFMNSALQCISNVSNLTNYIMKHGLSSSINVNNPLGTEGKVATAYSKLIEEMWSGNSQSISPSSLKKHVSELFPRFAGYGQQDSHEFLNALLDALHEDLKRGADETSLISDIFHGQIRSSVTCDECKKPFYSYDSISFLALPIPNTQKKSYHQKQSEKKTKLSINLKNCFDLFLKPEDLNGDNQWFCEECNRLTNAERILDLWTLPNILIIQLKRFSYDLSNNNKIETFIDYPMRSLDLNDLMNNPDHQAEYYDLIAVSVHSGSLVGGHYTTLAKNFKNQRWYHFDDATVRDVEEAAVLTGNAYILVYCKQSSEFQK